MTFIVRGRVQIVAQDSNGRQRLLGHATKGGFFGDFEWLNHGRRSARYEALTTCTLFSVEYDVITAACEMRPASASKFIAGW
jgi:CRP-like cAMP-binding protein